MSLPIAIICDLDGTLCNANNRRHYVTEKPKNWKKFYEEAHKDKPNYPIYYLINAIARDREVIYVSGRPDNYRKLSETWLKEWNCPEGKLLMRKEGDFRPDYEVKKEIYDNEIKDKYEILFCIDDRKQVVDMWRSQGLTCLQCADGEF